VASFLVLLIGVPLVELGVLVLVAQAIGLLPALALLLMVSLFGAWLSKRQGVSALGRINAQLARGEPPAVEVVDGALVLLAGLLMLVPGFVTAVIGLALLVPPVRALARRVTLSWLDRRLQRAVDDLSASGASFSFVTFGTSRRTGSGTVLDVDSVEVDPHLRREPWPALGPSTGPTRPGEG
jgi:UPF0716 protein FxsA